MKRKHILLLLCLSCSVIGYLFAPIDFIWFIILSLVVGIIESIILLSQKKRYQKFGILVLATEIVSLTAYSGFMEFSYNYYHIAWNIIYFIATSIFFFVPCEILIFHSYSIKKKMQCFLLFFLIVGLKSFVLDIRYYYTSTSTLLVQDVRSFKGEGYYRAVGKHKLLRKEPDKLTAADYEVIMYFLNETNWIEENFPDAVSIDALADSDYIKENSKYICSFIGVYNISKCDIYLLEFPLDEFKSIKLYFPKGSFSLYDESDMEKYYVKQLNLINNCYFEGVLLPPLTEVQFLEWTK